MKKSYIITAVVVLLAVAMIAVVFVGKDMININNPNSEMTTEPISPAASADKNAYLSIVKSSSDMSTPIMETALDDIFYTIDTAGKVSFFRLSGTALSQVEASGSYEITVSCAYQDLKADVSYYTDDEDNTVGFGLFLATDDESVLIYEYAFFYLLDLPERFASSNKMLVLIDTDKTDIYSNDKVYEESFSFNTSNQATSRFIVADNRTIDDRGAPRADYCMTTDAVIRDCADELLFFSSRYYRLFKNDYQMDIFRTGNWGNNTDNDRYIENIVGFYAVNTDEGVRHFAKTEDGFALSVYKPDSKETTLIHEFSGDFYEDYILSGEYLLNRLTLEIYDISGDKTSKIAIPDNVDFKPDLFEIDENGTYFIRGAADLEYAAIVVGKSDGAANIYYNDMFKNIIIPTITDDNTVMLNIAKDASGSEFAVAFYSI